MTLITLTASSLLVGILQHLPTTQIRLRTENQLIESIYQATKDNQSTLVDEWWFDESGAEITSSDLQEAITRLQQAGLLGRDNPTLINYQVKPSLEMFYKKHVKPQLSQEEEQMLQKLSKATSEYLNLNSSE
jgi:hypothetical protein